MVERGRGNDYVYTYITIYNIYHSLSKCPSETTELRHSALLRATADLAVERGPSKVHLGGAKKPPVDIRDVQSPDFAAKRFCVRFAGASPLPFQGSTVKADGGGDDNHDDDDDDDQRVVLSLTYIRTYAQT